MADIHLPQREEGCNYKDHTISNQWTESVDYEMQVPLEDLLLYVRLKACSSIPIGRIQKATSPSFWGILREEFTIQFSDSSK